MPTRQQTASAVAAKLLAADLSSLRVVLGFDGFVDEIIDVVDKRTAHDAYDRMTTIAQFGDRIRQSAGASANFELVVQRKKLGGQGPIMAHALATLGAPVTYIGAVGDPAQNPPGPSVGGSNQIKNQKSKIKNPKSIDPVFSDFARHADLIPLAPAARTLALEFSDGKLMLGTLTPLADITWDRIRQRVGPARLTSLFHSASLLGMLNWTMLPHLTAIWQRVTTELLATRPAPRPRVFIDLADPAKRDPADLRAAMLALSDMNRHADVTLGLNLSEASQILTALALSPPSDPESQVVATAAQIRAALSLDTVVIHPRKGAAASSSQLPITNSQLPPALTAHFPGPFTKNPAISTGGGDHFNAGFALAQTLNLPLDEALCLGVALSGYYVRHAQSPTKQQLADFLHHLPDPE